MPVTKDAPSSSPSSVSTSKILLFTGLALLIVFAFVCVAIRKRQTQNHRPTGPLHAPRPPSIAHKRPFHHDVHFARTAGAPTWCNIQPLAVQTPFRQLQSPQKDAAGRWPTIKRPDIQPSPSSRSDTSIDTSATLLDFETFPVEDFDRHLRIAVLIAMPLPPGPNTLSRDAAGDNMSIGVVDTLFPPLH